jgi:hypothetical protein
LNPYALPGARNEDRRLKFKVYKNGLGFLTPPLEGAGGRSFQNPKFPFSLRSFLIVNKNVPFTKKEKRAAQALQRWSPDSEP